MRFLYDARNRPLVELELNSQKKTFLIDTGFTGNLAIGMDVANYLDIRPEFTRYISQTAGGGAGFHLGQVSILWFENYINVEIHIWETSSVGPVDGLLGVNFLVGYILTIDFNEGAVSLTDPAREIV